MLRGWYALSTLTFVIQKNVGKSEGEIISLFYKIKYCRQDAEMEKINEWKTKSKNVTFGVRRLELKPKIYVSTMLWIQVTSFFWSSIFYTTKVLLFNCCALQFDFDNICESTEWTVKLANPLSHLSFHSP